LRGRELLRRDGHEPLGFSLLAFFLARFGWRFVGFSRWLQDEEQDYGKQNGAAQQRQGFPVHDGVLDCAASPMRRAAARPWASRASISDRRMLSRASAAASTSISGNLPLRYPISARRSASSACGRDSFSSVSALAWPA